MKSSSHERGITSALMRKLFLQLKKPHAIAVVQPLGNRVSVSRLFYISQHIYTLFLVGTRRSPVAAMPRKSWCHSLLEPSLYEEAETQLQETSPSLSGEFTLCLVKELQSASCFPATLDLNSQFLLFWLMCTMPSFLVLQGNLGSCPVADPISISWPLFTFPFTHFLPPQKRSVSEPSLDSCMQIMQIFTFTYIGQHGHDFCSFIVRKRCFLKYL